MDNILEKINEPIFFVTNDVFRGIGLEGLLPNYHIICLDDHPVIDLLEEKKVSVFCLERALGQKNAVYRSSGKILEHPLTREFIRQKAGDDRPSVLFFKPQKKLELIARKNNYRLLGNSSETNRYFEDKLSFYKICQDNNIPVPSGEITGWPSTDYSVLKNKYGETLVIQFGQGWAGNSTFFISSESQFEILKNKYRHLNVKISSFVAGITCLNNAVIYGEKIFQSKPAVQIKPMDLLTATQAGTGGRQWPSGLDKKGEKAISDLTIKIGHILQMKGYQGYFGLDFIVDKNGRVYLSECNARQTASVPFYTKLEIQKGVFPLLGFHLLSFLPIPVNQNTDYEVPEIAGGELIARNIASFPVIVGNGFVPGIYGQNLNLVRKSVYLDVPEIDKIFISTAGTGRRVNPEIELIRVNCTDRLCDKEGNLLPKYINIVNKIKEKLQLK